MTNKEKYRLLCEQEKSIPLFSQDWWLDIVCGKEFWDAIIIEQKNRIIAAMPVYTPAANIVSMPIYTQTMGPWFPAEADDTKYTTTLGKRQAICKEIISQLNSYSYFLQRFNYIITDWLSFYWEGYKQTTRYTYLLEDISKEEVLWEDMSLNTRRNITKAKEKAGITIRKNIPVEDFLKVLESTFDRQGLKTNKESNETLVRLINKCKERNQGEIWGGYDSENRLNAAVFIAWQGDNAYYIAGGGNAALRDSGAHSLVMWEAIREVSSITKTFDFEGSMIPGVERFFREFGAKQIPYFTITKGKLSLLDRIRMKLQKQK